jgi:uncharacterized protein
MAKGSKRGGSGASPSPAVEQRLERLENAVATTALEQVKNAAGAPERIQNGALGDAVGYGQGIGGFPGVNPVGFPGNQGNPWTPTISTAQTIFRNLRWYLVSNFRQMLSEAYVELGLVQTIVKVPVEDALRGGVEIKSQQLSPEEVEELQISIDRDDDLGTMGEAGEWTRLFGGGGILILTDQDPIEPLDLESIDEDTPLEFRACDMWELTWDSQGADGWDPVSETEDAEYYSYYGEQVHHSRVMKMVGLKAPSFIRPRLRGWGFSVVETLVRSINQYLKSNDLGFEVLDEFKVDVYKIKNLVNTLLSPQGREKVRERIQLANWQKNYQNAIVMDSEDDWDHKQLSFAGLGEAMREIRMQVASDMRMPLTKLFGISATGFNSGEDDIEVYNSMVESSVRRPMKYHILRMLEIKCQKLFGFIPDDLSISFKPLRVLSSEQEQNVKNSKFNRLVQARTAGELTSQEFRDAANKGELFDVKLEALDDPTNPAGPEDEASDLDEDVDDDAEDGNDGFERTPEDGYIEPGASLPPSMKSRARGTPSPGNKPKYVNWDEDQPRDGDGKFGSGSGSGGKKKRQTKKRGTSEHVRAQREAVDEARKTGALRYKEPTQEEKDATFEKSIAKLDPNSQRFERDKRKIQATEFRSRAEADAAFKEAFDRYQKGKAKAKNSFEEMPVRVYNARVERERVSASIRPYRISPARLLRTLNSAQFDKASYLADGGDSWIDPRRKVLFEDPRGVDDGLWSRAKEASRASFGEVRWQFVVWWYRKQGGSFSQL